MLGMLRLHLAAPPAGAAPVGKYAYKQAHFERVLKEDLRPETKVGPSSYNHWHPSHLTQANPNPKLWLLLLLRTVCEISASCSVSMPQHS